MNRVTRAAHRMGIAALVALGVAGCSNFAGKQGTYTCPVATTVPDLQTIAHLGTSGQDSDVRSAGRIALVNSTCDKEDTGVATFLTIDFSALRTGPDIKHIDLPYFVAIADSTGNILGKQQFTLGVDFPGEAPTVKATERVTAHLPLKNAQLGNVYTVIVGFQLSKNEIDFNRAHQQ